MKLLDLTLDSAPANLALDEALLEAAEEEQGDDVLRLWEATRHAVIVGRSSRVQDEVAVAYCQQAGLPILRRCSGGTAVVIGPGCLMYAVVLSYERYPALRMVDAAHRYVLSKVAAAVRRAGIPADLQGTSDLTVAGRKFSGNSLRCKREHLLYHGTLLCHYSLELISRSLRTPPRQPDYRAGRLHSDFVMNLGLDVKTLRTEMAREWEAEEEFVVWPEEHCQRLQAERYDQASWNFRL